MLEDNSSLDIGAVYTQAQNIKAHKFPILIVVVTHCHTCSYLAPPQRAVNRPLFPLWTFVLSIFMRPLNMATVNVPVMKCPCLLESVLPTRLNTQKKSPCDNKVDAPAKQAAATHPIPTETLQPSGRWICIVDDSFLWTPVWSRRCELQVRLQRHCTGLRNRPRDDLSQCT
uniref:Uncharacterized protein n=1 Tax=Eutreptiella gymnastica TaxID=73025 RepID=A0A7S1NJM9_9EUGL|mmetsp:Transcript_40691/g.72827  ORF Transcript_40691/g.72827 Transcript_40691/m.72827 type:complete len:171 (+) Transcript_40691:1004-1516(+)